MRKQFLLFFGIDLVLFIIGATVGENRGTMDSFMFWPIVIFTSLGLLYFLIWMILSDRKSKKDGS